MRPALVLALFLVPALLAGCTGVPPGTPEERAQRAFAKFANELAGNGTELTKLEGSASAGPYTATFLLEFGRDGARHAKLDVPGAPVDVWCKGDLVVRVVNGVATQQHAGTACPIEGSRFSGPVLAQLANATNVTSAKASGDQVYATISPRTGGGGGVNLSIIVDRRDRIIHLEGLVPGSTAKADATYDIRQNLPVPTATKRDPATARNSTSFSEGNWSWTARDPLTPIALTDVEVRVSDASSGAREATFRASDAAPQPQGGFTFTVRDENGDGKLNASDGFTLQRDGWTSEREHVVQVWDTWADAAIERGTGVNGVPGPGLAIACLALVLALALHSRQRG